MSKGRFKGFLPKAKVSSPPTVLHLKLEGARSDTVFEPQDPLPGISNYFIGKDPSQWHRKIPQYKTIKVRNIYPGVNLVYYGNQGKLEYDFVVQAGADPNSIRMKFEGAKTTRINSQGDVELEIPQGILRFRAPTVYQEIQGEKQQVEGHYRLGEEGKLGFEVKTYDPSKPLVIDPTLEYETYLPGGLSSGDGIALDSSGNAYMAGFTGDPLPFGIPLAGLLDSNLDGTQDAYVSEINAAGTAVVYTTYLGGSEGAGAYGIALDPSGNAYVTGITDSTDFPVQNPIQSSPLNTNSSTVFVAELSPGGSSLIYSTYLGGSGGDWGKAIAVDAFGDTYLTGYTASGDFPIHNAIQSTKPTGALTNVFVSEIGPSGTGLIYSTYLGGSGEDGAFGIAVDGSQNAYITGYTFSTDFPTHNPIQATNGGGNAFVSEISAGGSGLVYSTYLGGSQTDFGTAIAVDGSGDAYVTGATDSPNFPTQNPLQPALSNSADNVFVTEIGSGGTGLVYSTFLGGSNDNVYSPLGDYGLAIAVDGSGAAYITGATNSSDFPSVNPVLGAVPLSDSLYNTNVFVAKMEPPSNGGLVFSQGFFVNANSQNFNEGLGVAADNMGDVYITGETSQLVSGFFDYSAVSPLYDGGSNFQNAFIMEIPQVVAPAATYTPTITPTSTNTMTGTITPATATFSPTPTPTSDMDSLTGPPSIFDSLSPGAANVPVVTAQLSSLGGSPMTLTSLSVTVSGTGGIPSGIIGLTLSVNGTPVATANLSETTATFILHAPLPSSGPVTLQVSATFSGTSPVGTYSFNLTGVNGTNGQAVSFNGLPLTGNTITITDITSTPTNSPTASLTSIATITTTASPTPSATETFSTTPSPSSTGTSTAILTATTTASFTSSPTLTSQPSNTATQSPIGTLPPTQTPTNTLISSLTPTPSLTATQTGSWTYTSTATFSPTNTQTILSTPPMTNSPTPSATSILSEVKIGYPYPNPLQSLGPEIIQVQVPTGSTVELSVFTTAFRKVLDISQPVQGNRATLIWNSEDSLGGQVANGLYYLSIRVNGPIKISKILKVLVLR